MAVTSTNPTLAELIDAFTSAPPQSRDTQYHRLVGALWSDGDLTDLALPAARELVARLDRVDDDHKGYLVVLLGLLVQAEYPATDAPVTAVVEQAMDRNLDLWRHTTAEQPLRLALLYLLSQFSGHRDRILAAAADLRLDVDDQSRLDRALRELNPDNPVVGRMFPYPEVWEELDEAERKADQAWIDTLTPDQVVDAWRNDTRTVVGHAGAKAYWAVCNGTPAPVVPDDVPTRDPRPVDADLSLFRRHAAALRCPNCQGRFTFEPGIARCVSCSTAYPIAKGMLNLITSVDSGSDHNEDFLFQLAKLTSMAYFIDKYARPNFKRLCGMNWDDQVTPAFEDEYITTHVRPVDGPVLDLAAGGGRWTKTLAHAVGADRVIALDLLPSILTTMRDRLPDVPAVVANARSLPFADETLGAALCWNALQAFPAEAAAAIAEVGRCLRPGGTFTLFTFFNSEDPIYRYFVASHYFPQHAGGLHLFDLADLKQWLADAGLTVRDNSGPGLSFIITAEKAA
jgi:SAM-dependent methyltransferase